jgi:hypothetical protein
MVPSVMTVLQRFKTDWAAQLQPEAIHAACEAVGYTAWRDRLLNPVITVQLFLLQILHGNTACRHLPHLAGFYFSASASCQARAKLLIRILEYLLERCGQSAQSTIAAEGRWYGHRTFFVDGSGCSMPDTPVLQAEFGQPSEQRPGCGFPVARLLALFHAGTGPLHPTDQCALADPRSGTRAKRPSRLSPRGGIVNLTAPLCTAPAWHGILVPGTLLLG